MIFVAEFEAVSTTLPTTAFIFGIVVRNFKGIVRIQIRIRTRNEILPYATFHFNHFQISITTLKSVAPL